MAKGIRLMKAAKEFNIGKDTLVEFLKSKKFEVNNSPNTVLSEDMYDELMLEYAADKAAKKKSEKISLQVKQIEKEEKAIVEPKAEPEKTKVVEPKVEIKVVKEAPKPAPKEETPVPPKVEKSVKIDKKKEAPKEITRVKSEVAAPKIVGKVDVNNPKKSVTSSEKATPALPEVKEGKKVEFKKDKTEQPPQVITSMDRVTLDGPKVIGKVEIKQETPRPKKKRKRIPTKDQKSTETSRPNKPWQKKEVKPEAGAVVDPKKIEQRLKQTLNKLSGNYSRKPNKNIRKGRKKDKADRLERDNLNQDDQDTLLRITEFVSVSELASLMDVEVTDIISACMSLGRMVSINQRLDAELIEIVASEFDYEVEFIDVEEKSAEVFFEEDAEEDLQPRSPIVTIMGHVDHGKTSLLDYIRNASVVDGEAGGITQHIGAYEVKTESGKKITFLDTPGHEAFTAMRARGAKVTDVAIIVVAADDAVMPQTKEAISHAQAAEVPMIFAINKMDKEGANPDKIREQLSGMDILVEEWGGKFQSQEISAKKGLNIAELLEKVILESDMLELRANPNRAAYGTVVEASLDKGRGYVSTILVQNGTVRVGDMLVAGQYYGRVKAMTDERGIPKDIAGPSVPVQILGFNGAPQSGDKFKVYEDENEAKSVANEREKILREQGMRTKKHITLDEIGRRLALGNFQQLNLIIKGDVDGSVEALSDSLQKLSTDEIIVNVIHQAVGQITERDVLLASASDAIICGFQVRPSSQANKLAAEENIEIRSYSVIYDAIDEIKSAMEGMLEPKVEQKATAQIEVREVFNITGIGKVAGCFVTEGKIKRDNKITLVREGIVIYNGELGALKRFKDDVKEVTAGQECGLSIKKFNDIKAGDTIEAYEEIEIKRKL
jgi:translation initiation factor IF-2